MIGCFRLHCEAPCSSSSSLCLASLVVRLVPWSGFCIIKKPPGWGLGHTYLRRYIHTYKPSHTHQHSTHIHTYQHQRDWDFNTVPPVDWDHVTVLDGHPHLYQRLTLESVNIRSQAHHTQWTGTLGPCPRSIAPCSTSALTSLSNWWLATLYYFATPPYHSHNSFLRNTT